MREEPQEVRTCDVEHGTFPLIFWEVTSFIRDVLGVRKYPELTIQAIDLHWKENAVTRYVESSPNFIIIWEMFCRESVSFSQGTFLFKSISSAKEGS